MKRILVPTLSTVLLALFSIPAVADSPGTGHGGGGGGGGGAPPATFSAYCQNPQQNQTGSAGSVQPGDPDNCVISVLSGQVPAGTVSITLVAPGFTSLACPGGVVRVNSCIYQRPTGAATGVQIGRQDFFVSPSTPLQTRVFQAASICSTTCQSTTVTTQGPGAVIGGVPPPPPPSFPFATKVCTGEDSGGRASAGGLDSCTVSAFVGDSYNPGESVIVRPNSPTGTTVAECRGATTGSYETAGSITADGYCRLSVVSGTVRQFDILGTEIARLGPNAMPGTPLQQWVNFCGIPTASGDNCLAVLGFIPISGPGADVAPDSPVSANGVSVSATEGQEFSGTLATFTDADANGTFSEYAATIDWGDGTEATVGTTGSNPSDGSFEVTGSHLYAEEGSYTVTVSISDIDNAFFNSTTATSPAVVADAPLTASGVDGNTSNGSITRVANFTDADPNGATADYSASIDWGDGSASDGMIDQTASGFTVVGSHKYITLGPHSVTTHVCDVGGSCADATSQLLVYDYSAGGDFVIGDRNAGIGSSVTFWGAQWATGNSLSGGVAPDSFKGFANHTAEVPACGTGWTTTPGNSADPPATVPSYMAVIVASSVSGGDPIIAGDSVKLVVVKTESGYGPAAGHAGTGTVVGQIC